MKPIFKIVSAKPGEPSILWIGKSGRMYRTLVAAKIDKAENAYLTPETENEVTGTFGTKEKVLAGVVLVLAVIIIYKLIK